MYGESSTTTLARAWAAGTDSWTLEQRAPRGPHPSFIPDIGGWGKTVNFLGSPRPRAFPPRPINKRKTVLFMTEYIHAYLIEIKA